MQNYHKIFFNNYCTATSNGRVLMSELFNAFEYFCISIGVRHPRRNEFIEALRELGYEKRHSSCGYYIPGLELNR